MAERPPCTVIKADGGRCRAFALSDGGTCWWHDPSHAAERTAAQRKGARVTALRGRYRRLDSAGELLKFTSMLAQDILTGAVPPDVGRTVAYCVSIQRALIEAGEIERRLTELERRLEPREGGRRWPA